MNVRWGPVILLSTIAIFGWALLFYLNGCQPKPKFMNGDEAVFGPKTSGEVVEPDMPTFDESQK